MYEENTIDASVSMRSCSSSPNGMEAWIIMVLIYSAIGSVPAERSVNPKSLTRTAAAADAIAVTWR